MVFDRPQVVAIQRILLGLSESLKQVLGHLDQAHYGIGALDDLSVEGSLDLILVIKGKQNQFQ